MTSEIDNIMSYFYQKYKGEKSFKILMRLREYFVGIPRDRKQCFINRIGGIVQSIQYLVIKKVINQLLSMERFQIDLVFKKKAFKR